MQIFVTICAALFGLCFGSFGNVLIYRLPRGESIIRPPSRCPSCAENIARRDLVPVMSFIMLRGRCRRCKKRISPRYPAIEILCAAFFAFMAAYTGAELSLIPLCALAFMLLCASCIDMESSEIPDGIVIFGAIAGIIWIALSYFFGINGPLWHDALLGAVCGAAPLIIIDRLTLMIAKKDGFGYGDAKLMAAAGLFLGWRLAFVSLFFAVIAGGVFGAFLIVSRRAERGAYMPFGPFLSFGVLAALWFGGAFLDIFFGW